MEIKESFSLQQDNQSSQQDETSKVRYQITPSCHENNKLSCDLREDYFNHHKVDFKSMNKEIFNDIDVIYRETDVLDLHMLMPLSHF